MRAPRRGGYHPPADYFSFFPLTAAAIHAMLTVLRQLIQFTQEVIPTININYRDPRPIYEQVRDGLRTLIVSGALTGDEKLPSVHES